MVFSEQGWWCWANRDDGDDGVGRTGMVVMMVLGGYGNKGG